MFNSVRHFIKNIAFNSKLNREKFINNKKIVNKNVAKNKNNNMIIVRKMSTYTQLFGNNYNNNDNNNNDNNNDNNNNDNNKKMIYMFIMASGAYISNNYNNYNKKN
jgi:hypothetical protein